MTSKVKPLAPWERIALDLMDRALADVDSDDDDARQRAMEALGLTSMDLWRDRYRGPDVDPPGADERARRFGGGMGFGARVAGIVGTVRATMAWTPAPRWLVGVEDRRAKRGRARRAVAPSVAEGRRE